MMPIALVRIPIGWYLQQALKLKNPHRVTYTEITAESVRAAIALPHNKPDAYGIRSNGWVEQSIATLESMPAELLNIAIIINVESSAHVRYDRMMKVKEIIRLIEADGWTLARTRGSHRQYKNPAKPGLVTVPGKLSDDLAPGTLDSILKQAGLK